MTNTFFYTENLTKRVRKKSHQHGGSLVESVVALFVFSIGALGLAAMQTMSYMQSDDTNQRSIAVIHAQNLVDRILATRSSANPDGLYAFYEGLIGQNEISNIGVLGDANGANFCGATPIDCTTSTCNSFQVVAYDLSEVMCSATTGGVAVTGAALAEGAPSLDEVDIALRNNSGEKELYIEWLAHSANSNRDGYAADVTIPTQLCGNNIEMNPRLDAICIRFN